jgi:hypothetical protein
MHEHNQDSINNDHWVATIYNLIIETSQTTEVITISEAIIKSNNNNHKALRSFIHEIKPMQYLMTPFCSKILQGLIPKNQVGSWSR